MNRDDTFRKQTDNSPRSHTKFSVLPLCRFRLNSVDYWARLTVEVPFAYQPSRMVTKFNKKAFQFATTATRQAARVRRPAPQSLTMNKLGYLSILPFHSLPFRNKGPTDNSPRSHTEYTLFFPSRADYWASTIAALTCLSKSFPHVPFQVSNHLARLLLERFSGCRANTAIYTRGVLIDLSPAFDSPIQRG